jgi:hypothetical protein
MIMIRIEQAEQALALLRMVHADIEAMRLSDQHTFGEFQTPDNPDAALIIEWPNLSITWGYIDEFLTSLKNDDA